MQRFKISPPLPLSELLTLGIEHPETQYNENVNMDKD
jgi:hypothetical protein